MTNRAKLVGRLIFWPVFLWVVLLISQNPAAIRYRVTDWWRLRNYQPPAVVAQLAEDTSLTPHATDIFYASKPQLNDKATFNLHCPFPEQSFVLGCYDGDKIFIFDIQAEELEPAEPVTAAHEMLHAAWARMSSTEQDRLRKLLENEFAASPDAHLQETIKKYQEAGNDEGTIINELHSIVPTEVRTISPELEAYYKKYFKSRGKVVDLFESYKAIFAENEAELERLEARASKLLASIQAQEIVLNQKKATIDANNSRLGAWSQSSNVAEYNRLVSEQRILVREYNSMVGRYNSDVDRYQAIIKRYQELAFYHNELVNAINSKAETIR